jgi:hypothetical protein
VEPADEVHYRHIDAGWIFSLSQSEVSPQIDLEFSQGTVPEGHVLGRQYWLDESWASSQRLIRLSKLCELSQAGY